MNGTAFDTAAIRAEFPILQNELSSGLPLHYLDNAATSQTPLMVQDAIRTHDLVHRANVKRGVHTLAEQATEAYETARKDVARFINAANQREIVFTHGTTSSINLLSNSFGATLSPGDEIVLSILEHHSNLVPWQMLRDRSGVVLKVLPNTEDGRVDVRALSEMVTPRCKLITITHISNVTGSITDLATVTKAAQSVGAKVAVDGAQRVPHGPLDVQALGVDFYSFSGHKMFGPTGIGVLWGREELLDMLPPFMGGGEMIRRVTLDSTTFADIPSRFEAGTPPVTQAVGLAAAINWLSHIDHEAAEAHMRRLTRRVLDGLEDLRRGREPITVVGPTDSLDRFPVISFTVAGAHPHDLCQILDSHGVALRGGHHCAQPFMDVCGLGGTTRASLALYNNDSDIDAFLRGLEDALVRLT